MSAPYFYHPHILFVRVFFQWRPVLGPICRRVPAVHNIVCNCLFHSSQIFIVGP